MGLFRTDQEDCFDDEGKSIPCTGTGQDGESRSGLAWPDPRFLSSGDLVRDRMTGLIWPRDAGGGGFPLSWPEAAAVVAGLNRDKAYGRRDWRLPERRELFSLVSHCRINPSLVFAQGFENLFHGYYWTATPSAGLENQAWTVHLGGGRLVRGMVHRDAMVWPVAGPEGDAKGPASPLPGDPEARFRSEGGLVIDGETGLMWLQHPGEAGPALSWRRALEAVGQMNRRRFHGHDDWRLPNIRELESLVDLSSHSPALHPGAGFEGVGRFYWSATTSVYTPSYAWTLYTRDGMVGVGYKPEPEFSVWPVRSVILT